MPNGKNDFEIVCRVAIKSEEWTLYWKCGNFLFNANSLFHILLDGITTISQLGQKKLLNQFSFMNSKKNNSTTIVFLW